MLTELLGSLGARRSTPRRPSGTIWMDLAASMQPAEDTGSLFATSSTSVDAVLCSCGGAGAGGGSGDAHNAVVLPLVLVSVGGQKGLITVPT